MAVSAGVETVPVRTLIFNRVEAQSVMRGRIQPSVEIGPKSPESAAEFTMRLIDECRANPEPGFLHCVSAPNGGFNSDNPDREDRRTLKEGVEKAFGRSGWVKIHMIFPGFKGYFPVNCPDPGEEPKTQWTHSVLIFFDVVEDPRLALLRT